MRTQLGVSKSRCAKSGTRVLCWCGSMAEQLICNQQVVGSTPITSSIYGRIPEWPKGTDCKSAGLRLRWFESTFSHQKKPSFFVTEAFCFSAQKGGKPKKRECICRFPVSSGHVYFFFPRSKYFCRAILSDDCVKNICERRKNKNAAV